VSEGYFRDPTASGPDDALFRPDRLDRSVISLPLLQQLSDRNDENSVGVVFDLNLQFPSGGNASGLDAAGRRVHELLTEWHAARPELPHRVGPHQPGSQYVLTRLSPVFVRQVVIDDLENRVEGHRAIFYDAARASFAAVGRGIVWGRARLRRRRRSSPCRPAPELP